ncbi:MAG: ABC transporter ATP-binding protein [Candidatus Izemoplasmatales bacterium]|nr:ABC transporter ATP-binding protein [Candidatus Izemoplasmatales bacterium]
MESSIRVDGITKTFHLSKKQRRIEHTTETTKVAVNQLSFEAFPGEIYGLLGPNGAGKTTTLRCISTLIRPDQGDIHIDGHSVLTDPDGVRRVIGFLTSDLKLEDFFTPNYLFDYFSALHGIPEARRNERKQSLFQRFGIDKFAEVKVGELSTGMRQKIQIAISLVHDPDIIVFDEPTNGLDIVTAKVVTDYLKELRERGKTIIVSTHIFSLVEKICDRVGIIINGKLVYTETMERLAEKTDDFESFFFDLYASESEETL